MFVMDKSELKEIIKKELDAILEERNILCKVAITRTGSKNSIGVEMVGKHGTLKKFTDTKEIWKHMSKPLLRKFKDISRERDKRKMSSSESIEYEFTMSEWSEIVQLAGLDDFKNSKKMDQGSNYFDVKAGRYKQ
jgi:hypothetical protein